MDINQDNKIDLGEFCDWNIPSLADTIKKQVNEIFLKCDANKNNVLSKNEIIKNFEIFKTFEFTNFGEDLLLKNNDKNEHDEL